MCGGVLQAAKKKEPPKPKELTVESVTNALVEVAGPVRYMLRWWSQHGIHDHARSPALHKHTFACANSLAARVHRMVTCAVCTAVCCVLHVAYCVYCKTLMCTAVAGADQPGVQWLHGRGCGCGAQKDWAAACDRCGPGIHGSAGACVLPHCTNYLRLVHGVRAALGRQWFSFTGASCEAYLLTIIDCPCLTVPKV